MYYIAVKLLHIMQEKAPFRPTSGCGCGYGLVIFRVDVPRLFIDGSYILGTIIRLPITFQKRSVE